VHGSYAIVEAHEFTEVLDEYFPSDSAYADFQDFLAANPDAGSVVSGAGPLRKVRWVARWSTNSDAAGEQENYETDGPTPSW
jgi:hypothetical protein